MSALHLNQDDLPDLVVANFDSDDLSALLNQGPFPGQPPVAVAGPDAVEECTGLAGATVVLDGSASTDPDTAVGGAEDIFSYEWFIGFGLDGERFLGAGKSFATTLEVGQHRITLRTTDRAGFATTDDVLVTIQDTTPPVFSFDLGPRQLWPPNHRMVDVVARVSATDVCTYPQVYLESVKSNEPDDAPGDGDGSTVDDIQGADYTFQFQLRAERAGDGNGRSYTVTYVVHDFYNVVLATGVVAVPHDLGGVGDPLNIALEHSDSGTMASWSPVADASSYNVVRGNVGALHDSGKVIDLGALTCLDPGSRDTSTAGHEDLESPGIGQAFFYLVEYNNGLRSGYGEESAAKERVAPAGQGCP